LWGDQLSGSVQVTMSISFLDFGDPRVIGRSYSPSAYLNGSIYYPSGLRNQQVGYDISSSVTDIRLEFNTTFDFYYGTDPSACPTLETDYITILLHEMCHGLGFYNSIDSDTGGYKNGSYPLIYDTFLYYNGSLLTSLSASNRCSAIRSNALYWDGSNVKSANDGSRVKMYAPTTYLSGSSVSHWDTSVSFMTWMKYKYQFPWHTFNTRKLGLMKDLGWTLAGASVQTPTNLSASDGTYSDHIYVSWSSVSGATHYRLARSTISSGSDAIYGEWQSSTRSYNDYGVTPGVTYYYWVQAATSSSGTGASDLSSYNSGYASSSGTLPAPSWITASDGTRSDGVAVSWASVTGATHYKIARATSSSGAGYVLGSWYAGTSFVDKSVTSGVTYYYWVQAARSNTGSGASLFSSYNSGYRGSSTLSAPSWITASDGTRSDGIAVSWASVAGATHYKITRSTGGSDFVYGDWYAGTSFVDRSATSGVTYYYWVRAARSSSGSGSSSFSSYNSGYRASSVLPAPSSINASDGTRSDGIAVSWASVNGATHYRIARSTNSSGAGYVLGGWYAGTSFVDSSATPGVTYYYWVQAARSSSGSGASSFSSYNSGYASSSGTLSAPSWISASDGTRSDGVVVSWASVAGASHYKITRSTGGSDFVYSGWYAGTSFVDISATPGVTYYYWVQAARSSSGSGASSFSSYNSGYYTVRLDPYEGGRFDLTDYNGISLSNIQGYGYLSDSSDTDYYEIYIPAGDYELDIECIFQHYLGDIDITLYDPWLDRIAVGWSTTDNEFIFDSFFRVSVSGYYLIEVELKDSYNINFPVQYDLVYDLLSW